MQRMRRSSFAVSTRGLTLALTLPVSLVLAVGCNVPSPGEEEVRIGTAPNAVQDVNGLTLNGLTLNGLTLNGLTLNGLTTLSLATTSFSDWFNSTSGEGDRVMRYVARCALSASQSVSWTNPVDNVTYTWTGGWGLAPGWAAGNAATLLEQQSVSACLAAHANKYGISVQISITGRAPSGDALPIGSDELATWTVREGCFFGNLFASGGGVYSGSDRTSASSESSDRACALSTLSPGDSTWCAPITYVGSCATYCTLDSTGTWYESCTYGGVTYRPLTTRVRSSDVYTCGDGVCQFTESCGTGSTPDSCGLDCGACSP